MTDGLTKLPIRIWVIWCLKILFWWSTSPIPNETQPKKDSCNGKVNQDHRDKCYQYFLHIGWIRCSRLQISEATDMKDHYFYSMSVTFARKHARGWLPIKRTYVSNHLMNTWKEKWVILTNKTTGHSRDYAWKFLISLSVLFLGIWS